MGRTWRRQQTRQARTRQADAGLLTPSAPHVALTALVLLAGTVFAIASGLPAHAAASTSTSATLTSAATTTFPTDGQGLYESCNPADPACLADLDTMAQGRFQLVLNYSQFTAGATLQDEIAYAQHANALGLRILWPVTALQFADGRDHTLATAYPALAAGLAQPGVCPPYNGTDYTFVVCFVHAVSALPGTWGYYIGDELPAAREKVARPVVDAVYDADATHPRLYVATSTGPTVNQTDLTAFARSYCDGFECHADATVIAQDFYPVGNSPPDQIASQTGAISAGVQALAQQYHVQYGLVLQAHSLSQYSNLYRKCVNVATCPYPTQQQMLAMRDAALAHATPQVLLWYSYFDLQRSDNFAQHWSDLQTAANFGKPAAPQAGQLPPAPTPLPTPMPTARSTQIHADTATANKTSASGDILTPFGRFNGAALEALAQLALLLVLIAGMRVAIGRASAGRPRL